jgi:tyrosyl-DNA phosphodiesterase 2
MYSALSLLKHEVVGSPVNTPFVILLQEMSLSDLRQIQASKWIQDGFYITDISNMNWADNRYGTTPLVDKRLLIKKVFRVYYDSEFGRDAIFIDVAVSPSLERLPTRAESILKTLRIGNTHLKSLVASPPLRPSAQSRMSLQHAISRNPGTCRYLSWRF